MYVIAFLGAAFPAIIISIVIGAVAAAGVAFIFKRRGKSRLVPMVVTGIIVTLVVFGAAALINAYTTVAYGTVGLVVRFGGLTGQVFEPGLHWKTPFIDKVVSVPTIVQSKVPGATEVLATPQLSVIPNSESFNQTLFP